MSGLGAAVATARLQPAVRALRRWECLHGAGSLVQPHCAFCIANQDGLYAAPGDTLAQACKVRHPVLSGEALLREIPK